MNGWQHISSAPKDGTVVRLRNSQMASWNPPYVEGQWGTHTSKFTGKQSEEWVVFKDYEEFMPLRPGTLVCPTEWMPISGRRL